MRLDRYHMEKFLERHKIARYIYLFILAIISILFVILIFSWDSLLFWIITKEKSEFHMFIFNAILAVVVLIGAIVTTIILCRKKK